jgi:hypothetical protein
MTNPTPSSEPKFPQYPKTIADCIANSSETDDGILIRGHVFGEVLAFEDESTGRWYMIDICMECGTPSAGFTDKFEFIQMAKQYPVVKKVGG